jgi:gliding motility-associated-like protein
MKIFISLSLFLCINFSWSFGQFVLQVNSSNPDTCKNDSIKFTARVNSGAITDVIYTWSFGDGSPAESGLNLDTIKHRFTQASGYIVRVDASKGLNSDYVLFPVRMGLKPDFSGTNADRDSLCLGQQIFLTGKTNTFVWNYKIPNTNIETNPILFSNTQQYIKNFDYRIFNKAQLITAATNIDSVGIKLEHSNLSNVKIELKCQNGTSIILKDFGGADRYFGEPVDDEASSLVGVGYEYFWTNTPTFLTMNSYPPGTSLPAGSYTPQQAFSNLIGCPLNGNWEIIVTDNMALDNGFVFANQLKFNASLFPPKWQYNNTYSSSLWSVTSGCEVSSTSLTGVAIATPETQGHFNFKYQVKDNFGCFQDTSFFIFVEPVFFTTNPDPPEVDINVDIEFANKTSWATTFEWDFRDNSPFENSSEVTHAYVKDGYYWAKLTAGTDDGCTDTASVLVIIKIPPSVFDKMPGVFSPNGDAQNDVYFLNETSLKGIQSLECYIYSRWGKKVAEWHSVEEAITGWDGNIKGGPQASPGVYFYYIKAVGYDGITYTKEGAFHLFR